MSPSDRLAYRAPVRPAPALIEQAGTTRDPSSAKTTGVLGWAIPVYLLLISGGFAFLRSPLATMRGNELSIDRAAFTVVNAVTLTGFGQTIGLNELRAPGQVGVFVLMTGGTILSLIIGAQLVTRICALPFSNRSIALAAGAAVGAAMLFGAGGLGDTVLHGAFLGVSALGNTGLFIGKLPSSDDVPVMTILLPLVVAGGLGAAIWLDVIAAFTRRRSLSRQSLVSVSIYGAVYTVGLGLLMTQFQGERPTPQMLATCSTVAITARSAGFPLAPLDQFSRAGQWLLAGLMILGPASGGCGGGLKGTTLLVFCRGLYRSYVGERVERPVSIAAAWIAAYALLNFAGFLVLLTCAPQIPGDRLLFLTISAASNVGWSHDPVSLVKSGLTALSGIMLLGRMLPVAVLWWMARSTDGNEFAVG